MIVVDPAADFLCVSLPPLLKNSSLKNYTDLLFFDIGEV
jgi:hypothetical protein